MHPFPEMVLFDWDNTLIDTTPVLFKAYNVLRERYGLPVLTMEEYKSLTGLSLRETFPQLFGDNWEEARKVYLDAYRANNLENLCPFPDAERLIAFCAERVGAVGVVSNKTGEILRKEIEKLGWGKYFKSVVGAGDAERDKPAADPALKAVRDAGLKPDSVVWFAGDGDADIACARAAGCFPVRFANENKDGADVLTVADCSEMLLLLHRSDKSRLK